jgi:diacylglycerol kinase (ATP)
MAAELRTFRAQPFVLDLDGERVETEAMLVAIANGPSYGGGMRVCPDAQLDDGLFDVMVLRPVSKLTFVRIFPQVYSGRHVRHPAVTIHRARHVSVSAPGATAYADGERLGLLPISCHAVSGAVQMLVP